eukprot:TRINITY_DN5992_c1_g1_i1.p1 TRINITY_DN5992_c1_g1~~TRINITY_DN5992_c1_g1_i1.p1  ORF type:complete len:654 (-),score=150.84 TRINITY_DN5992_c1_g1_i1:592-2553(-)
METPTPSSSPPLPLDDETVLASAPSAPSTPSHSHATLDSSCCSPITIKPITLMELLHLANKVVDPVTGVMIGYKCSTCPHTVKCNVNGSTGNVYKHWKKHHLGELQKRQAEQTLRQAMQDSAVASPKKRARSIDAYMHKPDTGAKASEAFELAVGNLFLVHNLPKDLVESPDWRHVIDTARRLPPDYITKGRTHLTQVQEDIAADVRGQVINCLRALPGQLKFISAAIDGLTSSGAKITALNLLDSDNAFYMGAIYNKDSTNDAQTVAERLKPRIRELLDKGILIIAFVHDNEPLNGAILRILQAEFPWLLDSNCASHTLQLVVNKILAIPYFALAVLAADGIIDKFALRDYYTRLFKVQPTDNELAIIKPMVVRWNSSLRAYQRLDILRPYVSLVLHDMGDDELPSSFWTVLGELKILLKPFQVFTDLLQSDTSTLIDVYDTFVELRKHLMTYADKDSDTIKAAAYQAVATLIHEFVEHTNKEAVYATALLLDRKLSEIPYDTGRRFIIDWGPKVIKGFKLLPYHDDTHKVRVRLEQQLSALAVRKFPFEDASERLARVAKKEVSPKAFWEWYVPTAPEVAIVALALLSVAVSEASVERAFSRFKLVRTRLRNLLSDDHTDDEMSVSFNRLALAPTVVAKLYTCIRIMLDDA